MDEASVCFNQSRLRCPCYCQAATPHHRPGAQGISYQADASRDRPAARRARGAGPFQPHPILPVGGRRSPPPTPPRVNTHSRLRGGAPAIVHRPGLRGAHRPRQGTPQARPADRPPQSMLETGPRLARLAGRRGSTFQHRVQRYTSH